MGRSDEPIRFVGLIFVVHVCNAGSQQCESLSTSFRKQCSVTGYNQTFPIPFKMDPQVQDWIVDYIQHTLKMSENCTIASIAETISCSFMYAPYCVEGHKDPLLPCRRVCAEFFSRCGGLKDGSSILIILMSHIYGLCTLLPNSTAVSGKCYEPPGFEQHYNSSSTSLMQGQCARNLIPWCQNLTYNYTIMPEDLQKNIYKVLYDKNFTGDPVTDASFSNTSIMHFHENEVSKFPECLNKIKMVICSDITPPCFPGEKARMYSACQSLCFSIYKECPEIKDSIVRWLISECEFTESGNSSHGYCAVNSWPNPHSWIYQEKYFGIEPTNKPTKSPTGTGVIVAAVLVPAVVVAAALVIVMVILWRHRKLPWRYFDLKADDRKDLCGKQHADGSY